MSGIISEDQIEENERLFRPINREKAREQVIKSVREKQAEKQGISATEKEHTVESWFQLDERRRLLAALDSIAESNKILLKIERKRRRQGLVFGTRMTLVAGAPLTHIDFREPEDYGLPINTIVDRPMSNVNKLTIFNEGTGLLLFGTNNDANSTKAVAALASGLSYTIDLEEKEIEFINVRCTGTNTIVNIIAEI